MRIISGILKGKQINFIKNFSSNDAKDDHKKLWKRMENCFEELI